MRNVIRKTVNGISTTSSMSIFVESFWRTRHSHVLTDYVNQVIVLIGGYLGEFITIIALFSSRHAKLQTVTI